jgi:D-aspartate ligase
LGREGTVAVEIPGAIIVGGYVNGLGLVRSLAARNVATVVITTKPYDIAQRSRWISGHAAVLELEEQPERLTALLERRAGDWSGWAVIPTNDGALAALAAHKERLASAYRVIAPSAETARYFLDKRLMVELARSIGVDMPRCYGPAVEATAALPDIDFPVLVKPNVGYRFFSRFGCKLFVAHDRPELRHCIARFADAQMAGQVFDFIPGPDYQIHAYCTYVDSRGEPCGGLTVRKIRQGPPLFGVARVAEVVEDIAQLREATIEILRRIGFRGMAAAEFKLDPRDGRFRFIEVNGRSVIYNALLRRAGLDLVGLAWADHIDGRSERACPNGWAGVWTHLHADILYSLLYRSPDPVGLADFLAPYRRPKVYAVWSALDPVPFLTQWSRTATEGVSALWQGTHRARLTDPTRPVPDASG